MRDLSAPIVSDHHGVMVVRDDLYPGGTKARYIGEIFDDADVVVYASPCEGGAQVALAHEAQRLGKTAVIVCSKRREKHKRTVQAVELGARLIEIEGMSMYGVVKARARDLAKANEWKLAPFGLETPSSLQTIAATARLLHVEPEEVWCAASSGVLARGLHLAFPKARRHVVQIGHKVTPDAVAGATIHIYGTTLRLTEDAPDFPSDPHYDAKAWKFCREKHQGVTLFWNVTG